MVLEIRGGDTEEYDFHVNECTGHSDPRDRFEIDEPVKYSAFGLARLVGKDQRHGVVVGFSRKYDHCVRVRWNGNKTARRYAHTFIKSTA